MPLQLRSDVKAGELTVTVGGELDQHSARDAIAYIGDAVDLHLPEVLVLDLGALRFMDSSGLAVVLGGYRRMRELEGRVRLQSVPPQPMKVFRAVGLERLIPMDGAGEIGLRGIKR